MEAAACVRFLVALGMICVDMMLFVPDATGIGWLISCIVAASLTIPSRLIQKFGYKDNWGMAIGKGMIVGVLTAIPTPLPAAITATGGLLGTVGTIKGMITK